MIKRISRNRKTKNVSRDTIQKIRVEQISPNPNQARIDFDKAGLVELAESIKATGLLQQDYEEQENLKIMKIKTGAKKDKAKF
jgi:hypothetical protein